MSERHLDQLSRAGPGECLRLGRLAEHEVTELVARIMGDNPKSELLHQVHCLADGVPLYVEELLSTGDVTEGISEQLRMTMRARLRGLPRGAADLLDLAAVGEGLLHSDLVAEVSELDADDFHEYVDELVRRGILDEEPGGFRFHHALVRQAVRAEQRPRVAKMLHRRWAQTLEAGYGSLGSAERAIALAQQWYAADEPDYAVAAAVEAGLHAIGRGAAREATTHWERALEMWHRVGPDAAVPHLEREQVLDRVVETTSHTGDWQTLDRIAAAELTTAPRQDEILRLYLRLLNAITGRARGLERDYVVTPADLDHTVAFLLAAPDRPLLFSSLMFLWWEHAETPESMFSAMHDRMDRIAFAYGDRRMSHWATRDRCKYAMLQGRAADALHLAQSELDSAPTNDFYRRREQQTVLWALRELGRWREAAAFGQEMLGGFAHPAAAGWAWTEIALDTARSLFELGEWEESQRLLSELRPYADGSWSAGAADSTLGLIAARRGDWATANQLKDQVASETLPLGSVGTLVENTVRSRLVGAEVSLGRADGPAAWSQLEPALDALVEGNSVEWAWDVVVTASRAASLAAASDRTSAAVRSRATLLARAATKVHRSGDLGVAWVAHLDAHMSMVTNEVDPRFWYDVVAAWERVGHQFLAATAQMRLGETLVASGDTEGARDALMSSVSTALRLGAKPLLEEIRGIDRRAGLSLDLGIGQNAVAGDRGLTARELEVLSLLADGRTNDQMAAELFISPKTASVHVSRILAKLNASNRTEAAAIAHRNGLITLR